jgi:hypothetical protein
MAGAKITLFLPNGDAQSLRIAELSNWTGKAIAAPRSDLESVLARDELSQAGVYLLIGIDPENGKPTAYIGEGEDVGKRLRQHRDKEFWVQLIIFVSKDENLTKAHIRFLEGRLIEEASKTGRYCLANDQTSGAKLPEADREDMDVFLGRIRQLLPVLGCDMLVPLLKPSNVRVTGGALTFKAKGLIATGQRTPNGFVVQKGSDATIKLRASAPPWVIQMREKMKSDGALIVNDDRLMFAKDVEFTSPSAAAAVVCGGHVNGLTAWRNTEGKSLKEFEAAV